MRFPPPTHPASRRAIAVVVVMHNWASVVCRGARVCITPALRVTGASAAWASTPWPAVPGLPRVTYRGRGQGRGDWFAERCGRAGPVAPGTFAATTPTLVITTARRPVILVVALRSGVPGIRAGTTAGGWPLPAADADARGRADSDVLVHEHGCLLPVSGAGRLSRPAPDRLSGVGMRGAGRS